MPQEEIFQQAKAQHGLHRLNLPGAKIQCDAPPDRKQMGSPNSLLMAQRCSLAAPELTERVLLIFVLMPQRDNLSRFLRVVMSEGAVREPGLLDGMKAVLDLEEQQWGATGHTAQRVPLKVVVSRTLYNRSTLPRGSQEVLHQDRPERGQGLQSGDDDTVPLPDRGAPHQEQHPHPNGAAKSGTPRLSTPVGSAKAGR